MDTIILRDLAVHLQPPRDKDEDILEVRFIIQLTFSRRVFDTAGTNAKDPNELAWRAVGSFLVPTCSKVFTLSIVEYRPNRTSFVTAYSEVDTSVLYVQANRTGQTKCTIPVYDVEDKVKDTPFAEISFNTQLVSSNNNGRVTPLEVCDLVKTLDMIGIIQLLESISGDDDACVNACIGMLNSLYGVVHYIRDDPKDRPYALAMLSYIHVVRYDTFLEAHPDLGTTTAARHVIMDHASELGGLALTSTSASTPSAPYTSGAGTGTAPPHESPHFPQFIIFGHELSRAISMLEDAAGIIDPAHEKRGWLYLTLCRAIRSAMLQSEKDAPSFSGWTNKLAKHVRELGGERMKGDFTAALTQSVKDSADGKGKSKGKEVAKVDAKATQDAVDALLGDYLPGQLEWEKGLIEYAETALLKEKASLMAYAGHALLRVYGMTQKRQFVDEAIEVLEEAVTLELEWEKDKEKSDKWLNMDLNPPPEAAAAADPARETTPPKNTAPPAKTKGKGKGAAKTKAVVAPPAPEPSASSASSTSTFLAMGMGIVLPSGLSKTLTKPKKPKAKEETPTARKGGLYADLAGALIARYNNFEPHDPRDLTRAMEVQLATVQLLLADTDRTKAERLNTLGAECFEHAQKGPAARDPGLQMRLVVNAVASFEDALRVVGADVKEKCSILHHLASVLQLRYGLQLEASAAALAAGDEDALISTPPPSTKDITRIQTALAKSMRIVQPNDPERLTYIISYSRFFLFKFAALVGATEILKSAPSPTKLADVEPDDEQKDAIRQAVDQYAEAVALALVQRRGGGGKRRGSPAQAPGPPKKAKSSPASVVESLHDLGISILSCRKQLLALDPPGASGRGTAHRIISMSKDVLRMFDESDPQLPSCIMEIVAQIIKFSDNSSVAEVKDALAMSQRARKMAKEGTETMLEVLQGIGAAHLCAAKIDLERDRLDLHDDHLKIGISTLSKALDLVKEYPDHDAVSQVYFDLGRMYLMRYSRNLSKHKEASARKELSTDLVESSKMYRDFVLLAGVAQPEGAQWAEELATAYLDRYDEFREFKDLETAMTRLEWCIFYPRLVPPSVTGGVQPNEPAPTASDLLGRQDCIRSLFCGRFARFYHHGELQDFKNGMLTMSLLQTLRRSGPLGDGNGDLSDPDGETLFEYLAEYFKIYFDKTNDIDILVKEFSKQCKTWSKDASRQPPDKYQVAALMDPVLYLSVRLSRLHGSSKINPQLLDDLASAAMLISNTHPKKATILQFIGDILLHHFNFTKDLQRLLAAINVLRAATELSTGSPTFIQRATPLAQALLSRFRILGEFADIKEAVDILEKALMMVDESDHPKDDLLNRCGTAFYERYSRFGDFADMNKALQLFQLTTKFSSKGNVRGGEPFQSAVQAILHATEDSTPGEDDLDSILRRGAGWKTCRDWSELYHYGNGLLRKFFATKDSADITLGVSVFERAVECATTDLKVDAKVRLLKGLAFALEQRYTKLGDINDISKYITRLEEALCLLPHGHPAKAGILFDLGRWLPARYEQTGEPRDLELAFAHLRSAASQFSSNTIWRFRAASLWALWVKRFNQGDLLSAYRLSMDLLPQVTWLAIPSVVRQALLSESSSIVSQAVAVAAEEREEVTAVEWFEQGRSVIWGQLKQLRTPFRDLATLHPSHTARLQAVTDSIHSLSHSRFGDGKKADEGGRSYYDLTQEQDRILQEIRELDGFGDYMRPPKLDDITLDCRLQGPVIMINVSNDRCDALVVKPQDGSTLHIPLPEFTSADAGDMNQSLQAILSRSTKIRKPSGNSPSLLTKKRITSDVVLQNMLSALWLRVVQPILLELDIKEPRMSDLPRIWWCLSGPLASLPIHAAGLYSAQYQVPGHKLADFAISSYAPSLSVLLGAAAKGAVTAPKLLGVAFPEDRNLAGTRKEMGTLATHSSIPFTKLQDAEATVDNVISHLKDSAFVHFACYGTQKLDNHLDGSLILADWYPVSLAKLSTLPLPHAQFAFLSACQTAVSDPSASEESIYLGAGVCAAGYRSVIATMWAVPDEVCPIVADAFYVHLFGGGQKPPDATIAAHALHTAIRKLRESYEGASLLSWIPYFHMGV